MSKKKEETVSIELFHPWVIKVFCFQRKTNALRTYYVAEKNKMEQTKVSGAGTSDLYKSKWQYFDSLAFLSDNITPRATTSNVGKRQHPGSDDDDESRKSAYSLLGGKPSGEATRMFDVNIRSRLMEKAMNILDKPNELPKEAKIPKSADKVFGEMVSGTLETRPDGQAKDILEIELQKLVYETKYMAAQRVMPQNYQRNVVQQPVSNFSAMIGQEPYQPNIFASSPQTTNGSTSSFTSTKSDLGESSDYTEI